MFWTKEDGSQVKSIGRVVELNLVEDGDYGFFFEAYTSMNKYQSQYFDSRYEAYKKLRGVGKALRFKLDEAAWHFLHNARVTEQFFY